MSRKKGHIFYAQQEEEKKCYLCGSTRETRPYGPNGEDVCFKCAFKDEKAKEITERQFDKKLVGVDTVVYVSGVEKK